MIAAPSAIEVDEEEISRALDGTLPKPGSNGVRRIAFPQIVHRVVAAAAHVRATRPLLQFAYSVKTNPSPSILRAVKRAGFFAEVIGPAELEHVRMCGFDAAEIVYNGPHPARYCVHAPEYVFADSIEAFSEAARRFPRSMVGLRLRPPAIRSRFGVERERANEVCSAIHASGRREIGVSFHVRPQDYGGYDFRTLGDAVVEYAIELERRSGAVVTVFDAGGGKRPFEMDREVREGLLDALLQSVAGGLPYVRAVLLEPGQALATSCEAVIATILEKRRSAAGPTEIVIDAGYPDFPQIHSFPHRLFFLTDGKARPIRPGRGRILGDTCLEYDVVCEDVDVDDCSVGDAVVVADTGAYDASMAFSFARGRRAS